MKFKFDWKIDQMDINLIFIFVMICGLSIWAAKTNKTIRLLQKQLVINTATIQQNQTLILYLSEPKPNYTLIGKVFDMDYGDITPSNNDSILLDHTMNIVPKIDGSFMYSFWNYPSNQSHFIEIKFKGFRYEKVIFNMTPGEVTRMDFPLTRLK